MIKDILKIHDKYSIEIKQTYYSVFDKKDSAYRVLTYLFIPNGLNINEQTYSREQFYQDSRVNIRYNTPEWTLLQLIQDPNSPLNKFKLLSERTKSDLNKNEWVEIETTSKMLATVISSAIRLASKLARRQCKAKNAGEPIQNLVDLIRSVLELYRGAVSLLSEKNLSNEQINLLYFSDEYISNSVEHQIVLLLNYLEKNNGHCVSNLQSMIDLLKYEQAYKEKKFYNGVSIEKLNHEYIIYKRSQLKKYVDSILFLSKDIRKDGTLAEQTIFAIAAGLAMLFSTGIAFYYQMRYGSISSTVFVALVISYMMKDRIKGWVSNLFISKAKSLYYDYKIAIFNSNKNKVGLIKENFRFVPYQKLGPKVKKYRFIDRTISVDDDLFGEQIIQYKKMIMLYPQKLGEELNDDKLNSIVDITRFNLFRFTQNMDNTRKSYFFVKNGKLVKSEEDRVYHINIIQKFYTEAGIGFKRYRVVLNRDGIKRIERVRQDGLELDTYQHEDIEK